MSKEDIIKWANEIKFSAHDVFDDMNDNEKVIKTFLGKNANSEMDNLLSVQDAELLAYEYGRRLIEHQLHEVLLKYTNTIMSDESYYDLGNVDLVEKYLSSNKTIKNKE